MKTEMNYEPSNIEIFGRMCKMTVNGIKRVGSGVKSLGKPLTDFTTLFGGMLFLTNIAPYILAWPIRVIREQSKESKESALHSERSSHSDYKKNEFTLAQDMGGYMGVAAGVGGLIGQMYAYQYAIDHNHPEVLGIPIATNLVSLGYEMYRSAKNSLREEYKSQVNSESSGIDKIVQRESSKNLC